MRLTHTHVCISLCSWCWLMDWMVSLLSVNTTTFKVPFYKYCWWQHFLPAFSSHPSSLSSYWCHCYFYSMLCHLLHPLLSFPLYCHLQGSVYHCWMTSTGQMYPLDYSHSVHYFITAANMALNSSKYYIFLASSTCYIEFCAPRCTAACWINTTVNIIHTYVHTL